MSLPVTATGFFRIQHKSAKTNTPTPILAKIQIKDTQMRTHK